MYEWRLDISMELTFSMSFNIAYIDSKSVPIRLEQKLLERRRRLSSYFIRRVIVITTRNFYEVAQPHENFWVSRRLTGRRENPIARWGTRSRTWIWAVKSRYEGVYRSWDTKVALRMRAKSPVLDRVTRSSRPLPGFLISRVERLM